VPGCESGTGRGPRHVRPSATEGRSQCTPGGDTAQMSPRAWSASRPSLSNRLERAVSPAGSALGSFRIGTSAPGLSRLLSVVLGEDCVDCCTAPLTHPGSHCAHQACCFFPGDASAESRQLAAPAFVRRKRIHVISVKQPGRVPDHVTVGHADHDLRVPVDLPADVVADREERTFAFEQSRQPCQLSVKTGRQAVRCVVILLSGWPASA